MKVQTYLAKFYDVFLRSDTDLRDAGLEAEEGQLNIEIYDQPDDCEPIGWLVRLPKVTTYEWRNIYGDVKTGTKLTEAEVKQYAKAGLFYTKAK